MKTQIYSIYTLTHKYIIIYLCILYISVCQRYRGCTLSLTDIDHVNLLCRGRDINKLLIKHELFWIYNLNTMSPKGLNEEMDTRPCMALYLDETTLQTRAILHHLRY